MKQCRDCKWWQEREYGYWCAHPNHGNYVNGWVCHPRNRKYYERKWWKFWGPK